VEALVRSPARRNLCSRGPFSEDALSYFTERLDSGPTRQALFSIVQRAKRNKAFENSSWIGLAIDGTSAGWRTQQGARSVARSATHSNRSSAINTIRHDQRVGTGLSLPLDVEPMGLEIASMLPERLLRRVIGSVGKRFAQYVVVDGEFATAPFLHTAGDLGLCVVARLKDNLPELFTAAQQRFACCPPTVIFQQGQDQVEIWDADDFDPWNLCAGKPCASSAIASTSRMARVVEPTG